MKITLDLYSLSHYMTFEENLEYISNKIKDNNDFNILSIDQLVILNSLLLISASEESTISENNKKFYFKSLNNADLYYKDKKVFKSENQFLINELSLDINKYNEFSYMAWNESSKQHKTEQINIDWSEINGK